ncbi:MAG: phosphonate C-P lyase system protein PhnH [Inhella sp.]
MSAPGSLRDSAHLAELAPAFGDPVHDAQAVFRVLLEAMSRPGRVQSLPVPCRDRLGRPDGLAPALAASLLTLLDADTTLWIGPTHDTAIVRAWLRFHTGVTLAEHAEQADFVLLAAHEASPALLDRLYAGSDVAPQDSATVLTVVDAIAPSNAAQRWRGPGIEHEHGVAVLGPRPEFWAWRRAQQGHYPCGLDWVFFAEERLVALPRSTGVEGN